MAARPTRTSRAAARARNSARRTSGSLSATRPTATLRPIKPASVRIVQRMEGGARYVERMAAVMEDVVLKVLRNRIDAQHEHLLRARREYRPAMSSGPSAFQRNVIGQRAGSNAASSRTTYRLIRPSVPASQCISKTRRAGVTAVRHAEDLERMDVPAREAPQLRGRQRNVLPDGSRNCRRASGMQVSRPRHAETGRQPRGCPREGARTSVRTIRLSRACPEGRTARRRRVPSPRRRRGGTNGRARSVPAGSS